MKKFFFFLIVLLPSVSCLQANTQRQKIAVFMPMYLDSAFSFTGNYAFNKTFPKFLNAGIEFYQGVQSALDSLQKKGTALEVYIYDSKSQTTSVAQQMRTPEMADV